MARGAVTFVGAIEQREPAQLRRGQSQLAGEEEIVFGIERTEIGIEFLVLSQREGYGEHRPLLIVENLLPEDPPKLIGIRRPGQACDQVSGGRVRHLVRREEWA